MIDFPEISPAQRFRDLRSQIVSCHRCHLSRTRTNAVPGDGPRKTELMFVGEAPGRTEDAQGKPFVGRAGRILDQLLNLIGVERNAIFIGNIVKCRPISSSGGDRRPTKEEISICSPYLDQQISIIGPSFICTLGDTSTRYILEKYRIKPERISKLHGRIFDVGSMKIIPMFHPAAILYRRELEEAMKEDFRILESLLKVTP